MSRSAGRALLAALLASTAAQADVSGHRWFNTPVPFRVAATVDNDGSTNIISGGINYSGSVIPAIQTYFHTWTKSQVSGTTWDSSYTGTFSSPLGSAVLNSNDSFNSVIFLSGSNWHESAATLGLTLTTYITSTGEIVDADMEFNNATVVWDDTATNATAYDYPSVILHEAGHFLGLNHSASSLTVMYYAVNYAEEKRALAAQDISDVQSTYPVTLGGQGTTCSTVQPNCSTGLVCRTASGGTSYICTVDCTGSGVTCPTGYTCQNADTGKACLPQLSAPDLCKFCTSGGDCSTGTCVTDGAGHNWCSNACTSAAACGTGYACVGTGLCAPANYASWDATCCPNQCTGTGTSTCPLGYVCSNGSCNPTGNDGDRCEVAGWCRSCLVCVGTTMQANCRACCGGSQSCAGCTAANCGASATCTGLTTGDSVCIPTTQSNTCQACSGNTCPTGELCVAGACHTTCNPTSPGTCTACFDSGGGNGICACPNEVASLGQQCGLVGTTGFFACQTGLACVGTPPTCQRQCTLGDTSSCNLGEQCQAMGSVAVCVAGTIGSQCAACGTNNACSPGLTCNMGRCYVPCNVNAGVCSSCVALSSNGDGVCACPDQVGGVGSTCGSNPVAACSTGALCIDALCRGECDLANPGTCGILEECQLYPANAPLGAYCLPLNSSTGGGGGSSTGGGSATGGGGGFHGTGGGGGGGGTTDNTGCNCGASGIGALWALLGVLGLAVRRRRA